MFIKSFKIPFVHVKVVWHEDLSIDNISLASPLMQTNRHVDSMQIARMRLGVEVLIGHTANL